jgi:hypothetical protein
MEKGRGRLRRFLAGVRRTTEINVDLAKIVSALAALEPVSSTLFGSLISKMIPIQLKVDLKRLDTVESEVKERGSGITEQQRRQHLAIAAEIQDRVLREGAYYCNVGKQQQLQPYDLGLLDFPPYAQGGGVEFGVPLLDNLPEHLDLLVVDALLIVEKTNGSEIRCYLSDYPTILRKADDPRIRLRVSKEVTDRLSSRPELALGWHPYCRILGQLRVFQEPEPLIEPLLISLRSPTPVSDANAKALAEEWAAIGNTTATFMRDSPLYDEYLNRQVLAEDFESLLSFKRSQAERKHVEFHENLAMREIADEAWRYRSAESGVFSTELYSVRSRLEQSRAFEDNIFSGPLAFLIGFYHYLGIRHKKEIGPWARPVAAQIRNDWSTDKWRDYFTYLRSAGVLRLNEGTLEQILAAFDGHEAV